MFLNYKSVKSSHKSHEIFLTIRDVTMGKCQLRLLRWWAESAPLGWDRVKLSENLGATSVAPVAPVITSLCLMLVINSYFCLMCLSQINKLFTTLAWLLTLINHLSYLQRKFPVQICINDKIIYCCQLEGYEVSNCRDQNQLILSRQSTNSNEQLKSIPGF